MNSHEKIAVAGATGYVGSQLVPALHNAGYTIRCLARTPEKITGRAWDYAEVVQADVFEPASLNRALAGVDIAYYLVHSMGNTPDFEQQDKQAASNFAAAAKANGIRRIIYLGGLADEDDALSHHLKSRHEVGWILGETGIPVTELRASIIIGSGSASFEIIRDLARKLPVMITPRWVNSLCEPISITNVVTYLIESLRTPETTGEVLEIGGGERLSYGAMLRKVSRLMGRPLFMFTVPVLTPRLSAYWLNLVTSVPMQIAYPLVDGLRNDTVCHDFRIREWIPQHLMSFEDSVKESLAADESVVESRWTEASIQSFSGEIGEHEFIFKDIRSVSSPLSSERLFQQVKAIGGDTGWYSMDWAWKLRGILDRVIGGVGMRRGRRDPADVRIGDVIDFWRVVDYKSNQYIRLQAEMKLPGKAWLEFEVMESENSGAKLIQTASFIPSGILGHLYWYLLYPIHSLIFRTMARNIANDSQE